MAQAILASWSVAPGLTTILVLLAALYARGWHVLRRQMPERFPVWRLPSLPRGPATLHPPLPSPLRLPPAPPLRAPPRPPPRRHLRRPLPLVWPPPPLLLRGAPAIPLLRGLPPRFAKSALGPFLAWPALQRFGAVLLHPVTCWCAF